MTVYNKEFKFSFEIPDEFEEIQKDDYSNYHLDEASTLHVFLKTKEFLPTTISINRDDFAHNEEEYVSLVGLNLANIEKMGLRIKEHTHYSYKGRRIDIVYSSFKRIKYATYFTVVNELMIASSIEIKEINDKNDQILNALFESIYIK